VAEWVVDTNVLIVATRAVLGRPPRKLERRGEDVPVASAADLETVYSWLETLRRTPDAIVVLDLPHHLIEGEYAKKLDKNEYGRMVIAEKLTKGQYRPVEVERDGDGHALILHACADEIFDREDRKMVAAALEAQAAIANACDTDWCELEQLGSLGRLGVTVHHVIETWCRSEWQRKREAT
jgi:uncharacterized protein YfeS